MTDENLPYVVKSPWLADEVEDVLRAGILVADAASIPMRNLFDAAESRRAVYREAQQRGVDPLEQPGTLWKTREPEQQELHLANQFYRFLYPLVQHGVPIYFLDFPRFASDVDYLTQALAPVLSTHGVASEDVATAFARVARPELIARFKPPTSYL